MNSLKNSKKGQNITKPYTIILILIIIASFSGVLLKFGQDLAGDPTNTLNNESITYIYARSGFDINNITVNQTQNEFYTSESGSEGNTKDEALEFRFFQEKAGIIRPLFQSLFEAPSFIFLMMNIDQNETWNIFMNVWNVLIWLIIFYGIYRLLRGLL